MTQFRTSLMTLGLSAVLLSGCATMQSPPVTDGERTKTGAAIGALVGGLVATTSGDKSIGKTLAGALAGGIVGGAIGQALDKQARDLEARLDNDDVRIVNTGSELVVTMPQDILFAVDSAAVKPALQSDIAALADNLAIYPNTTVDIVGHTDSTGEAPYNQQLSARRAQAVTNILTSKGVSAARLRSIGRGEAVPIATNLTEEGRMQNRRVEIIIRPTA